MDKLMPYIIIGAGLFSVVAVVQDWDFFMNSRRARLFVGLFGRQGARVFYGVLGVALMIGGAVFMSAR